MRNSAKLKTFALAIILLLSACNNKNPRPDFMPNDDDMAWLFTKIHITESMTRLGYISTKEVAKPYYRNILKEYDLTPQEFDSCLAYLSRNRDTYEKIYVVVMQRLRKYRDEEGNEERLKALSSSIWKDFGVKELDTSKDSCHWVRLDSINNILPPDFRKSNSYSGPYIE